MNGVEGGLSMSGTLGGGSLSLSSSGTGGIVVQSSITTPNVVTISAQNTTAGDVDINSTVGGTKTSQIVITAASTNIIGGSAGKLVTNTSANTLAFIQLNALTDIRGITTTTKGVTITKQLQIDTLNLTANTTIGDIDINAAISTNSILTIDGMTAGDSINLSSGGGFTTAGFTGGVTGLNAAAAMPASGAGGSGNHNFRERNH